MLDRTIVINAQSPPDVLGGEEYNCYSAHITSAIPSHQEAYKSVALGLVSHVTGNLTKGHRNNIRLC